MKRILIIILVLCSTSIYAQQSSLIGSLITESGEPLMYGTAVLLNPIDSTMAYYGVTDQSGQFKIKNVKAGTYILQAGFIGYQSHFRTINYPSTSGNDLGAIVMLPHAQNLSEVQITANRIPLLIKKDTVEYTSSAFKTKTDAIAEDLLKKLPGIEIDRAGNIKAQGEDVTRVLVDGKEFFSSDPTVATKNLPANAIDKVQVYNKKSDETELSGIEDGSYSKTINMILKEGQKSAFFGDITGGMGTDKRFQAGAKAFRFTKKYQFAALGMINNINKAGFSFQDYLDFQGGLQSMMSGGGGMAHRGLADDNMPIDFGRNVNGLVSSAAAGLNFTREARVNNRFNISYLGNGSNKNLEQTSHTKNYTASGNFTQDSELEQDTKNRTHRLNYTWRNRIDKTQNLSMFGGASLSNGSSNKSLLTESFADDVLMNNLFSNSVDESDGLSANSRATYLKTGKGSLKLFKVYADINYNKSLSEAEWNDITNFLNTNEHFIEDRFQKDDSKTLSYSAISSLTFKIGKLLYLVPSITIGAKDETLLRTHALDGITNIGLSPKFKNQNNYIIGGLAFNRNTTKTQFELSAQFQSTNLKNTLNSLLLEDENYLYFLPRLSWKYEYSSGKRLAFNYRTSVNAPSSRQLLPVTNNTNPLQLYTGNVELTPEYSHNARFSWLMFDQFSSTSIFASINGNYTRDKIVFSRTILDNLSQQINLKNAGNDYRLSGNFDFTTPIRKLGIDVNVRVSESWNRGISFVNEVENIATNFSHTISLYFNNRKKDKWDLMIGGRIEITDAKYSLQERLNNHYVNMSGYGDLSYTPNDKWFFSFSSDITRYSEQSFGSAVSVPILRAEISHYFLKNKRGVLTLSGHDLLDKNTGVERISQMNYLRESISNVMGRYFMLTFKYRLNKFDNKSSGMKIEMSRGRR